MFCANPVGQCLHGMVHHGIYAGTQQALLEGGLIAYIPIVMKARENNVHIY